MRFIMVRAGYGAFAAGLAAVSASGTHAAEFKVYSPLVETGVLEMEYRGAFGSDHDPSKDGGWVQKAALGYGLTPFWFTEVYGTWTKNPGAAGRFDALEWENRFQLTEQGEYWADFGLLAEFEYANDRKFGSDEIAIGPLIEKDFGPTTATANIVLEKQLGPFRSERGINLTYRWQWRWRVAPAFQPAVQMFGEFGPIDRFNPSNEQEHLLGPAVVGKFSIPGMRGSIEYDAAYLFGLTQETPRGTLKFNIEYEYPL